MAKAKFGLIACPSLPQSWDVPASDQGCLLVAAQGEGAYMYALDGRLLKQIRVAETPLRFAESFEISHGDHGAHVRITQELGITASPIQIDSQANTDWLHEGRRQCTCAFRIHGRHTTESVFGSCRRDNCGEEAGGSVTDTHGQSLNLLQGRRMTSNRGIVATNGTLHDHVLEIIRAVK